MPMLFPEDPIEVLGENENVLDIMPQRRNENEYRPDSQLEDSW
jgi:hypothetical protein